MRVIQGTAAERRATPLEEAYAHFRGLVAGRRAGWGTHYSVADSTAEMVVATAVALAHATFDAGPVEVRARPPTRILDLLRENADSLMSLP